MTGSLTIAGPKISLSRRLPMRRVYPPHPRVGRSGRDRLAGAGGEGIRDSAPCDRRHYRDLVLFRHLGLEPGSQADVFIVQIDVDELPQLPSVVQQAVPEPWVAGVERVDGGAQIGGFHDHCDLPFGEASKRAWNAELRHC